MKLLPKTLISTILEAPHTELHFLVGWQDGWDHSDQQGGWAYHSHEKASSRLVRPIDLREFVGYWTWLFLILEKTHISLRDPRVGRWIAARFIHRNHERPEGARASTIKKTYLIDYNGSNLMLRTWRRVEHPVQSAVRGKMAANIIISNP